MKVSRSVLALLAALAALLPGGVSVASEKRIAATAPSEHFASAANPYAFVWPRDHAAHPAYRTEWWYYTGHVTTASGRRFDTN
jgi:predicted secreted hydrolase